MAIAMAMDMAVYAAAVLLELVVVVAVVVTRLLASIVVIFVIIVIFIVPHLDVTHLKHVLQRMVYALERGPVGGIPLPALAHQIVHRRRSAGSPADCRAT